MVYTICLFLATRTRKIQQKKNTTRSRTCSYIQQSNYVAREKLNLTLLNHIFKLERQCRAPQRARMLLLLCHTVVKKHVKTRSPGGAFLDWCGWRYGRITECRTNYIRNTRNIQRQSASSRGLVPKSFFFFFFFCGRCNTAVGNISGGNTNSVASPVRKHLHIGWKPCPMAHSQQQGVW